MSQKRIDILMVEQNKAKSRTEAQAFISQGLVSVNLSANWQVIKKPSEKFYDDIQIAVQFSPEQKFVSRAALKLDAALEYFPTALENKVALDIGQSTGGFTDCLLQRGAGHVIGLEVGHSQLVESLRTDKRVTVIEHYNARNLILNDLPSLANKGVDIVVMDVSFISQHLILPNLPDVMKKNAMLYSLVKPQFEVGREAIGKNGIVKDKACYKSVEVKIKTHLESLNFSVKAYMESPIKGGDGNREFIVIATYSLHNA